MIQGVDEVNSTLGISLIKVVHHNVIQCYKLQHTEGALKSSTRLEAPVVINLGFSVTNDTKVHPILSQKALQSIHSYLNIKQQTSTSLEPLRSFV